MSDFAKDTNVYDNDCISRQAAIDAAELLIKDWRKDTVDVMNFSHNYNHGVADAIATLKHLPSAERRGRWEELMEHRGAGGILGGKDICVGYACSECGEQSDIMTYYCPNCGSRMDLDEVTK